jgi:peptidyl-prolyl cis-trans isomerase B (cyclophilin B)
MSKLNQFLASCLFFALTLSAYAAETINVTMETNQGTIELELYRDKAPLTVENFVNYANDEFYKGTIFHRVIKDFMIQGGGFTDASNKKETNAPIKNEADNGLKNDRGTIAMARTPDPHSATSQFFINLKDNDFLNHSSKNINGWGYCVFGKVTKGMDIVDKIADIKTRRAGMQQDYPTEKVMIKSVTVKK